MELVWSKKMSVGNESIDLEHKLILDLVNEIEIVIRMKDSALFIRAIEKLEKITFRHFQNEENIAHAINYPFKEHHIEHQYILGEFQSIKNELAKNQSRWSESIAEHYYMFLSTWAVDHVIEDDMKMKPFLEACPYDFKPGDLER